MKKQLNQQGQSTIEFIFTFVFGVSIVLMIFNSALNYATGYLVHYATFMASRTYLTADQNFGNYGTPMESYQTLGEEKAKAAFQRYNLGLFNVDPESFRLNHTSGNQQTSDYLSVGAYTFFFQRIDVIGRVAGQNNLMLISESFLGKEPTRVSCAVQTCKAMTGQSNCESITMDITLFDDGC